MTDLSLISNRLFDAAEVYSLDELNDVIRAYATNDDRIKDIVEALYQLYTTLPQPTSRQVQSPAQVQALVDGFYDLDTTAARMVPLSPGDPLRYYQEIRNCFGEEPFASLISGATLDPKSWVKVLRVFTILKGLLYWVEDGPNYEAEPVYAKVGSLFLTTIDRLEPTGDITYKVVDEHGVPANLDGVHVFRPLPAGRHITLMDFWLNRLTVRRLRQLYRLGAFELGIDSTYRNDAAYRFVDEVFTFATTSPATTELARRFPCGFAQAGAFRFLREDARVYAPQADLKHLHPATGGIEDRVVIDESLVQTPMGLMRIPRSIVSWQHLLTDADRASDPIDGDPVVFVGLRFTVSVQERDVPQVLPMGEPALVAGNAFDALGIFPLEKGEAQTLVNWPTPVTGTQRDHLDVIGGHGHQHGQLIGYIHKDVAGPTATAQYVQVAVEVVAKRVYAAELADALTVPATTRDEVALVGENSSELDVAPVRTFGVTPRKVLDVVQPLFTGFTHDREQVALVKFDETVVSSLKRREWQVILPVALNLLKNDRAFTPDNLNGCAPRFADAWAIRRISSVQKKLGTIVLDDGLGAPENFPADFIGAEVTIFPASGEPITTTLAAQLGDKLAKLPENIVDKLAAGDVLVIDRRVPEGSLDHTYRGEVTRTSLIDLRVHVQRLVDPEVSAGSPTTLTRHKPVELVQQMLAHAYGTMLAAIESKVRYDITQRFFAKAAHRYDLVNLKVGKDDLKSFLLQFVKDYERNKDHDYVLGENVIVHWPEKSPRTVVKLTRYPRTRVLNEQDELAIEDTPGWGPVPVMTKLFRATSYNRYPIRFDGGLTFISDRNFSISGHTKLAGTFFLRPTETQIVDPNVHVTLYQTRLVNGVTKRVFLGSVDFDYRFADSFRNAEGIIRIDNDAAYDPTTQRLSISYNQTVNFSQEEPGQLTLAYSYHDLTEIHPLWQWFPTDYGIEVSHLANAEGVQIQEGSVTPIPDLTMRLDGISVNGGQVTVRWDREDAFKVVAGGLSSGIRTKWVVRGLPFIVINSVTYDDVGQPIDVDYDALWVERNQTITTQIANDTRCRQTYQPCSVKYGWTDVTQSNINTEALPFIANPRFGFYELRDFLDEGALRYGDAVKSIFFTLEREPMDYRFTQPFDIMNATDIEVIGSVAVLLNRKTKQRTAIPSVYRGAANLGSTVALDDELDFVNLSDQDVLYVRLGELSTDWVLDFAGLIVTVRDDVVAPEGSSKLSVIGYWYAAHDLVERAPMTVALGVDALQFNTALITKVAANWRIGDLPGQYLYRDNNLLVAARGRPA